MTALALEQVSLVVAHKQRIDNVTFLCRPGTVTCLVGPNGSGKSTLLSILAGQRKATSGSMKLADLDLRQCTAMQRARRLAFMPQTPVATLGITAREVVSLGLWPYATKRVETITEMLELTQTTHLQTRPAEQISGGERQRIELARVLVQLHGDGLLAGRFALLDEPTASLDVKQTLHVAAIVRELASRGIGFLVAIHDLELAWSLADQLVILHQGRALYVGKPSQHARLGLETAFEVRFELKETRALRASSR